MKAGKKKNKGTTEKITKFPVEAIEMEDLDDEELDALLEEELKREADELEARLNSDPKLIGVGASDDLFAKIVASLKEQGVWEEDEAEAKKREESECVSKKADEEEAKERVCVSKKADVEEIKERDDEAALSKTAATLENSGRMEQSPELTAGMIGRDAEQNTEKKAEKIIEKDTEENIESERTEKKNRVEAAEFSRGEKDGKDPAQERYVQLSEEDRRAMEYGYEMQQKDAAKKVRRKKRRKIAKRAGITAAALVAVFGVSMTSDANRKYVLERWNAVVGNIGMGTTVDYVEENESSKQDMEEEKAQQKIREELEVEPLQLKYLPSGWNFVSCEIEQEAGYGVLFYSNGNQWLSIYLKKNEDRNVSYYQLDGKNGETEAIKNIQNITFELQKVSEEKEETYAVVFSNEESSYYCSAQISYEEIKKIIENMIIL